MIVTKAEENILNQVVTKLEVMNINVDNHIKEDIKHRDYVKKKLCSIENRMEDGDKKFNKLNIAVFGTEVEKYEDGLVAKGNIHGKYHKNNEEKWGSQTYFKNHLKQFAILIIVAIFGLSLLGYNINSIAQVALKAVGVKIDLPAKEK